MSLAQATSRSINTAFVPLVSQLGACNVRATETRLGLHQTNGQPVKPFPAAIILGADSVSPMTVVSAYGSLGHDGIHCTPVPVSAITGPDGRPLPVPAPGTTNCTHVVDPAVTHGVTAVLQTVLQPGGTGAASALAGGRPAAGKTGTTNGNNETWFVGYTPQLTTAVWTGTPLDNSQALDNVTLRGHFYPVVFGASVSAPIWKAIMDRDLTGQPNADFPPAPEQIRPNAGLSVADATNQPGSPKTSHSTWAVSGSHRRFISAAQQAWVVPDLCLDGWLSLPLLGVHDERTRSERDRGLDSAAVDRERG
jgi:membrane peptidoglycan carboxypeptidase